MPPVAAHAFLSALGVLFRSQLSLRVENVALRHQLAIYQRTVRRPTIRPEDRILWSWLSRCWARWRDVLIFVQPETVLAWQRRRFRDHWARRSRAGTPGRPQISKEIRELIRTISSANSLWGTPRIVGELGKLGIKVAKSTVDKYRVRSRKAPSPNWKAFLKNHVNDLVSIDFFIVPTIRFKLLYRLDCPGTFTAEGVALQHYRESDRRVDCPADRGSLSLGQCTEVSPTRSRCDLRRGISKADSWHGHRAGVKCTAKSVAKSVRRKAHRYLTTRLPRPCHPTERASSQARRFPISRLLPRLANAPLPLDGRTEPTGGASAGPGQGGRISGTRRPASPLRTLGCVTGTPR